MAVRINLESAIRYLNSVAADKLDGLLAEAVQKAADLGIAAGTPPIPETAPNQAPTGNFAGLSRFVRSLHADSATADKDALSLLLGCLKARATGAGRIIPTPVMAEGTAPVAVARRRRRRA